MNITYKILILFGAGAFLASCSNYGYISENDVYMQAPTEINLEEDENDITSFNSFKARNKGAFEQEYKDPRINERIRMNQIMIISSYGGYGFYRNGPIGFHGMGGYYDPFYGYDYRGFNSGIGFGMYGGRGYYSHYGHYYPYGYGYNYNPYFQGGHYGSYGYHSNYYGNGYYGNGYYGGGYYGGVAYNNNSSSSSSTFYGQRNSMTSSSNRSSFYAKPKSQKSYSPVNNQGISKVEKAEMASSRKVVERRSATGTEYIRKADVNRTSINSRAVPSRNNQMNSAPAHRGAVKNTYVPSSSARGSVVPQTTRNSNFSNQSPRSIGTTRATSTRPSSTHTSSPRIQQSQSRERSISTSPSSSGSSRGSSSVPSRRR